MKFFEEITLKGSLITLIPLQEDHADALVAAAADGELWNLWFTSVPGQENISGYIKKALDDHDADLAQAFVVQDNASGKIIGCTRYCNASPADRRVEIGYTWYARSAQRTGVNTECKFLLLRHAFETLHCIAVEFRTSWMNTASRAAIQRLGAKQDGVLRNHALMKNGSYRDTVVFSIIESEWPACKANLEYRMKFTPQPS